MSEDALVTREQRGNISVLTMVYRPYNLLGPKLINAIVEQVGGSAKGRQPRDRHPQRTAAFLRRRRSGYLRQACGGRAAQIRAVKTGA